MIDTQEPFRYQLECSPTAAIIYLGGYRCTPVHVQHIAALVNRLPTGISTLRADLQALDVMDFDTLMQLRSLLSAWRAERSGVVRLQTRNASRRCA